MTRRYALTDAQWERIEDLLPGRPGHAGRPAGNNRLFVDAVLYRYRAGIPWRDLPERFGDFRVIYLRHSRWSRSGVWQRVFEALAQDADNEWAMIDSTIVRAHRQSYLDCIHIKPKVFLILQRTLQSNGITCPSI